MEQLFCHKLRCVNRSLFCLPLRVGNALTCSLGSVLLGANMALGYICILFSQEKKLHKLLLSKEDTCKSLYFIYC